MSLILIAEDNPDLANGLRANLALEGHRVVICADGNDVLQAITSQCPDMLILDIMLPNKDGFQLLHEIRQQHKKLPILMLTARDLETDKVRALRSGADDYLTKPFGLMELLARVEALLRRTNAAQTDKLQTLCDGITLKRDIRQIYLHGKPIALTPKEYDLLIALVDQPNKVHTRQALLRKVWAHQTDIATRTIDTHIAELRRKLEPNPTRPKFLRTARGAGYWFKV